MGAERRSRVGVLVERSSRYLMLVHLPDSHRADVVADSLAGTIQTLPGNLRRSLTWDQSIEMARHLDFTVATAAYTRDDLETIAAQLNTRPRKTLGYLTPAEKLSTALVAVTS